MVDGAVHATSTNLTINFSKILATPSEVEEDAKNAPRCTEKDAASEDLRNGQQVFLVASKSVLGVELISQSINSTYAPTEPKAGNRNAGNVIVIHPENALSVSSVKNMNSSLLLRADAAPSADNQRLTRGQDESQLSPSIIATLPARFAGFCASVAMSISAISRSRVSLLSLSLTFVLMGVTCNAQISLPNAVPFPNPEIQFLDSLGAPLAGSKLCTYGAGTSTPLATYTDSTAGTPNSNPIILDSFGRASVWVGPSLYKFVLRTGGDGTCSTGSVQWSQDNVADTTLYFVNFVKTVGTSTMITYVAPQTGAVSRTQFSKNTDVLSVKDFGAAGDGSTDDTAAINTAMALSIVGKGNTPGVCIYFPDGIYKITAALSYNHTVCMTGNQWRLKYTGGSTINAVLKLVGDVNNVYGTHCSGQASDCYLEGSFIEGAIIDGQGNSTNGFTLQGVVGAQVNYMRVTNVTGTGVSCNWCQQATFERLQVSSDFETFTTTPVNGIIIDNISAANILNQVNIDHVSGDGISMPYGLNTLVHGGTSEGVGGYGVSCTSGDSPFHQCANNVFIELDTESNTSGDYLFADTGGGGAFANTLVHVNSFSIPGITFSNDAHDNTLIGGTIGCGSTASASTFGNTLRGLTAVCVGSGSIPWVDSGSNINEMIFDQFHSTFTQPANNYNTDSIARHSSTSGSFAIENYTPSNDLAEFDVGNQGLLNIGFATQTGLVPWLIFPVAGMQFISETGFRAGALPEGSVVNHHWGFGRFNTNPLTTATVHTQDSVFTTVIDQNAPGQASTDLHQFMQYGGSQDVAGTVMSKIDYLGNFVGPVISRGSGGNVVTFSALPTCTAGIEGAIISISDSTTNTWGANISGGGTDHVLAHCAAGGAWTVMAK